MIKKASCLFLIAILILSSTVAFGNELEILPYASDYFDTAKISLKESKEATYRCIPSFTNNSTISVSSCYLEIYISAEWVRICNLTPPPASFDPNLLSYTMNYANNIGTGRYRIWATFNAGGHTITRCSNERTY